MARNKKNREQVPSRSFFYIGAIALVIALGVGGSYWYSQYRVNAAQEAVEQGDRLRVQWPDGPSGPLLPAGYRAISRPRSSP